MNGYTLVSDILSENVIKKNLIDAGKKIGSGALLGIGAGMTSKIGEDVYDAIKGTASKEIKRKKKKPASQNVGALTA